MMGAGPGCRRCVSSARRLAGGVGLAALLALQACHSSTPPELTPGEISPELAEQIPASFYSDTTSAGPYDGDWIVAFGDSGLVATVDQALRNNFGLRQAAANLEAAAAVARQADKRLEPIVALSLPGAVGGGGGTETGATFGASLDLAWEVDVWGRISSGQAAALADFQAAAAAYDGARLSLAAQTTKAWFLATQAWKQLQIADSTAANLRGLLDLTLTKQEIGQASEQDVRLTRADLASAEETATNLQGVYRDALRSLEVILGRYPAAQIEVPREFLPVPPPVPPGLPSEILERRPDVVAADRQVAAAFSRVDSAKAARLPRLSITASVGGASDNLGDALNPANAIWNVGANLLVPIFDQGGRQLGVEVTTAQQKAAVAEYAATGLGAFREVESALDQEGLLREREEFLRQAVEDNAEAYRLAQVQFDVGAIDQLNLLQMQTRLFQSESQLVTVQGSRLANRVNLHLALGGSFEVAMQEPESGDGS